MTDGTPELHAITAALNVKNPKKVMVWCLDGGYASFEQRTVESSQNLSSTVQRSQAINEPEAAGTNSAGSTTDLKNYIPFEGSWSFASASTPDLVYAFAVRDDYKVCMISPTYQPLPHAQASSYSIAACGGVDINPRGEQKETIILYYLYATETNRDSPSLAHYNFFSKKQRILDVHKPNKNSRLCAFYEREISYCFYIIKTVIYLYDSVNESVDKLQSATGAAEKTPMAVCTYHNVVCLFYLGTGKQLFVVLRHGTKWGGAKTVPVSETSEPFTADTNSDLSAVADPANSAIRLYYRQDQSDQKYNTFVWEDPKLERP